MNGPDRIKSNIMPFVNWSNSYNIGIQMPHIPQKSTASTARYTNPKIWDYSECRIFIGKVFGTNTIFYDTIRLRIQFHASI